MIVVAVKSPSSPWKMIHLRDKEVKGVKMKCKCRTQKPMIKVSQYQRENFASYTTMTIYYCENCGRLARQEGHEEEAFDYWEHKGLKKKKSIQK